MQPSKWFDRDFPSDLPIWILPNLVERLRGTPACLRERLVSLSTEVLIRRKNDKWSIQENAGHLLDLEPLWMSRLKDFIAGREILQSADLSNRASDDANHNERALESILEEFALRRRDLVSLLEQLDEAVMMRTALHPRLKTPMRVTDLGYFIAEHDIHHLARITELIQRF